MRMRDVAPWVVMILIAVCAVWLDSEFAQQLRDTSALSGWVLLGCFVTLGAYNLRKKLAFLPLFSSASWLRVHIAIGLLTVVLFMIHISWQTPNGTLEVTMTLCYATVAVSGLFGWALSRVAAKALARRGEEVIYEQIPGLRLLLREEAHQLALAAVGSNGHSTVLAPYREHVLPCLVHRGRKLASVGLGQRQLLRALAAVEAEKPFSNDGDRETLTQFSTLLRRRSDLDFHADLQGMLKVWFFVHVPLTWALLSLTVLHVILAYRFAPSVL